MFLLGSHAAPDRCPDRQTLADFNCGRLAEPDLEAIDRHLASCETCLDALSELQSAAKDGFDARLRQMLEPTGWSELPDEAGAVATGSGPPDEETKNWPPSGSAGEILVGTTFGRYAILEEIGKGGMGVVYRAERRPVKQVVALKTIRDMLGAGPDRLARFHEEGKALARLWHPNVVQLYHFDGHNGRPYFTMELVDGGNLADKLAGGPLAPRAAAEMIQILAGAVEYAHGQKVVHRDLKPTNVLIGSDGTPKITDFGLAKVLGESGLGLTETDAVMGTPSYMAPEQAEGRTSEIGERTDVYALGAVLYELLTGVPPFMADSKGAILALVREGNVIPPSRLRREVAPDLEAVCLKCLEKFPGWRYQSAEALADDLGRWLRGEPTEARPLTRARRVARWARRNARRGSVVACALVLALVGAAGGAALLPRNGGSAPPNGESEAVRRELEAELDAGRPVTLVGETGWPKWFRWRAGKEVQRTHIEPDGAFSAEVVERHVTGLLELLPDPRTDRYKLTAQLRHDYGGYAEFVGLYVAHRTYPRQPRDVQFFAQARFNAVAATPRVLVLPQPKERVPENHTQRMSLALRLHTNRVDPPGIDLLCNEVRGPRFVALGARNGVWHDLEVTVTPDGVVAIVNGHRMELSASLKGAPLQEGLGPLSLSHSEDPIVQNVHPEFTPRGGLGLVFYPLSAASVRRVTVTPLPARR